MTDTMPRAAVIPESHRDLVTGPRVAALTTLMPDGSPQTSVVWCDHDATHVRVNCMRGFRKERNMRLDPRVTLLCYDPRVPLRYLEVRGVVEEMTEVGAREHLDDLCSLYLGKPTRYFGECIAAEFETTETPILCRILPSHVVARDWTRGGATRPAPTNQPAGRPTSTVSGKPSSPEVEIPESHVDLFARSVIGVLTTLLPGGRPQSSLVWVDHEDGRALVNTTLERQKGANMVRDPRVSLLVVDPEDTSRYVQVRGEAELVRGGAVAHLDALTRRYTDHPCYYGHVFPAEQATRETRVICRIHARRVTLDAIHR